MKPTQAASAKKLPKAFLLVIAVLAVAAVIAVTIVLTQQSSASDAVPASLLGLPHLAVLNLSVVSGAGDDDSKEKCAVHGRIPTGVKWETTSGDTSSYLCMLQSLAETQVDEQSSTAYAENMSVVHRLVVVSDAEGCPPTMQVLVNPASNVFVCLEYIEASSAFRMHKYVVDVITTREAFYNHNAPGWLTWPVDLTADPEAPSVFVSVRYPILPIVALRGVTSVASNVAYTSCEELDPVGEWETPGLVLKSSSSASHSTSSDIVVCAQRLHDDEISSQPVLLNIAVFPSSAVCPVLADNTTTTEVNIGQIKLCAEWGHITDSASFVVDLSVYQTTEGEAADTNASASIPGGWQAIGDETTGHMHTFFLARKFEPAAWNAVSNETLVLGDELEAVASSVEAIAASNNMDKLSFRVLQIADLHLTGDPDYPCSSGPTIFRASLLESAWRISRDLKMRSGVSSSSNRDDDTLYNECREAVMIAFLEELLDIEQPDFVVFSGDNVHTYDSISQVLAISIFTERVESRGIPWTAVFGNHDTEGGLSREAMLKLMTEGQQFSHMKYGPQSIDGVGNYEVNVVAPTDGPWGTQGSTVFRMYFLDSHGFIDRKRYPLVANTRGYDWIKERQILYYKDLASSHDSVPAVMFFHIPIPEYALSSPSNRGGGENEDIASSHVNCGLFSALVELGDVKATFAGHDHVNEYCYLRQGIQLCYGGGIGLGRAYGLGDFQRRARVIEWTYGANQARMLRSWKRHLQDPTQVQSLEVLYSN